MLTIVISTWENGLFDLEKSIQIRDPDISYLIVHQTQGKKELPLFMERRTDVEIITSRTKGLSVSRNIGLQNCRTPYALIADDDVEYIPEALNTLLRKIERDRPSFTLCKIQTLEGEPEYKEYPKETYRVKGLKHWVSSIEILVDIREIMRHKVYFDERFGLGSMYDRGEEEVFVHDLMKHNLEGVYYPLEIVKHPYMSSGKNERSIEEYWFVQGALDERVGERMRFLGSEKMDGLSSEERRVAEKSYNKGRASLR